MATVIEKQRCTRSRPRRPPGAEPDKVRDLARRVRCKEMRLAEQEMFRA
jgi:hypothetical protein